jgi:hypothetical protein
VPVAGVKRLKWTAAVIAQKMMRPIELMSTDEVSLTGLIPVPVFVKLWVVNSC